MVITVTLNPAVDKTMIVPGFSVDCVNRVRQIIIDAGGKGINVSKSVQALGGETCCLGILGGDTGRFILAELDRMGLPSDMVMTESATRTNIKVVDLEGKTNTDINEPGPAVTQEFIKAVEEKLYARAKPGDTVVFAGKVPPGTPEDLAARWTADLGKRGVRICLDTVGLPMELAMREKPFLIKPNAEELQMLLGRELRTVQQIVDAAREVNAMGVGLVAVSMGAEGAVFVSADKAIRTRSPKVAVVSTVGAGDAMMAALAHYSEAADPLELLARKATAVASATVTVEGSRPASLPLVESLLPQIEIERY